MERTANKRPRGKQKGFVSPAPAILAHSTVSIVLDLGRPVQNHSTALIHVSTRGNSWNSCNVAKTSFSVAQPVTPWRFAPLSLNCGFPKQASAKRRRHTSSPTRSVRSVRSLLTAKRPRAPTGRIRYSLHRSWWADHGLAWRAGCDGWDGIDETVPFSPQPHATREGNFGIRGVLFCPSPCTRVVWHISLGISLLLMGFPCGFQSRSRVVLDRRKQCQGLVATNGSQATRLLGWWLLWLHPNA